MATPTAITATARRTADDGSGSLFFFLSKTLDLVLDPWWWGVAPMTVGAMLLVRGRRRAGLVAALLGLLVLSLFSLPGVANRLWSALESDAVSTQRPGVTYDVVVLLGGAVSAFGATADQVAWGDNVDRLTVTFDLLRSGTARSVIVSGGHLRDGLPTEAEYLARQLEAWGIEPERVIVEGKARNTAENARFTKALIDERGFGSVLVVTSAFHLPRSLACFRAVGLKPDVRPVDFRMREPSADSRWFPRAGALADSSHAIREFSGRLIYALTGAAN